MGDPEILEVMVGERIRYFQRSPEFSCRAEIWADFRPSRYRDDPFRLSETLLLEESRSCTDVQRCKKNNLFLSPTDEECFISIYIA
jgi:hypothetical protein